MFIPLVKNLLLAGGYCFTYFPQISGLYIITFPFHECFCLHIPIKGGISISAFNMNVYRFMFFAPEEEAISV